MHHKNNSSTVRTNSSAHYSASHRLGLLQPTRTTTAHVRHGPRVGPEGRTVGARRHHAISVSIIIPGGAGVRQGLEMRGRGAGQTHVAALRPLLGVEVVEVQAEGQEPQDLAGLLALLLEHEHELVELRAVLLHRLVDARHHVVCKNTTKIQPHHISKVQYN